MLPINEKEVPYVGKPQCIRNLSPVMLRTIFRGILLIATALVIPIWAETECDPCETATCVLDPCGFAGCDPCEAVCGSSMFKLFRGGSRLKVNGWIEAGIIGNAYGAYSNGGTFLYGPSMSRFNVNQIGLSFQREMDASKGFDWGGHADFLFGIQGKGVRCIGDESFDYGWSSDDADYGFGANQFYVTLGYKKLSVDIGKIGTPIGWEGTRSWDNFFFSHSNVYYIEPITHTGFLASYAVNDRLTVFGGWVAGMENFVNRFGDNAFLGGFEVSVTKNGKLYYYLYQGRQYEGQLPFSKGWRNGGVGDVDYFLQSICYEWNITDRLTYLFQYDLNNLNPCNPLEDRWSAYGINNHLLYTINDHWAVGFRFEWMHDNGGNNGWLYGPGDYYQYTWGLNWNPTEHLRIRPEIRYDIAHGVTPFGKNLDKSDQFSGGIGILWGF